MARRIAEVEAAKIAPPSLQRAVSRPLLLARLGEEPDHAKWLHALSGSGKSTLAHQYAQTRERTLLWYRLDPRDDDPAFFFAAFGRACGERLRARSALPRFAETDYGREAEFAQRLLRALLSALRGPALIVFDDAHKVTAAPVLAALAAFAAAAQPAVEWLFVAETPPPAAFFDAIAARRLALCNDLDLRFDAADCATVGRSLRLTETDGDMLAALSGGHAAALVIACALLRGAPARQPTPGLKAQLHAHLLEKLVARLGAAQRDLLLVTCFMPRMTPALAQAAADRPDAATDLDALADRGLLIRHKVAQGTVYEMHGLVRAGMRAIAERKLGAEAAHTLGTRCAELLEAAQLPEDAFALRVELGRPEAAAALLEPLADWYARRQQPLLLMRAIDRLPRVLVDGRPLVWLLAGHALLGIDDDRARAAFAHAYDGYANRGDRAGMALAAASQLIALNIRCSDASGLDQWLARFHDCKGDAAAVVTAYPLRGVLLLGVLSEADIGEAEATTAEERDRALDELTGAVVEAKCWLSADQQITAAWVLIAASTVLRTDEHAKHVGRLTRSLADDRRVSPLQRGRWWHRLGLAHCWSGDVVEARRCVQRIEALIESESVPPLRYEAARLGVETAVRTGELGAAATLLPELLGAAEIPVEVANAGRLAARVHLLLDRPRDGLAAAETSLKAARMAGLSRAHARMHELEYAYALAAGGDTATAARHVSALAGVLTGVQHESVTAIASCLEYVAGGAHDATLLARGLELARRNRLHFLLRCVPRAMAHVCSAALEAGIEVDFVTECIRQQRLAAPPGAGPAWPWQVRLRLLGSFRLEVGGVAYRPERKAPQRPLDLLKLIAVHEGAQGSATGKRLALEQLWPDAEGEGAAKALDMAVARLRRLLGSDDVLDVSEGKLALAEGQVWSDVRALHEALARLRGAAHPDAVAAAAEQVRALYRGPLLAGEEPAAWLLGARRQLAQAVAAAATDASARAGAASAATAGLLEHLFALEPANEEMARALMALYQARGEHVRAIDAYRTCRAAAASTLGIPLSARTEQLRADIAATAAADTAAARSG